jgi:hypothetical protein
MSGITYTIPEDMCDVMHILCHTSVICIVSQVFKKLMALDLRSLKFREAGPIDVKES